MTRVADTPLKNLDSDHCYQAIKARDARFDGVFFVGVSTTGIYCRPVCTVRAPRRDRCTFYSNAASAEAAGYRPCLRCRPELAPGTASIDAVKRVANAAVMRIESGALNNASVDDLANEFGLSSRQLRRVIETEYGVNLISLAQTQRLLLAKQLLTDTSLRVVDVAFASGFASVRQFNRVFRQSYRLNPLALRKQSKQADIGVVIKLGYRPPLAWNELINFLVGRSSGRTEQRVGQHYRRTVQLGSHHGWIAAHADSKQLLLHVQVSSSLLPVLPELQVRLRRLFDLNANPIIIDQHLKSHSLFKQRIKLVPGLRVPGSFDGFALALRAILGQQITVKAASTIYGRFVDAFGEHIDTPFEGLDRSTPRCKEVANATLQQLIDLGLTSKRAQTISSLARAMTDGVIALDPPVDVAATRAQLQSIAGIGEWTAHYISMRALNDPDAFPHSDLGLLRAANIAKPKQLLAAAEAWRPWRAYAALHLWHQGNTGG